MSFKTKAIGLVAAAALSLSITTGVMADDSVDVTAELREGTCRVTLTSTGSLGLWDYTGQGYELRVGQNDTVEVTADLTAGSPSGCNVTVDFQGLGNGAIGLSHFSAMFQGQSLDPSTVGLPFSDVGVGTGQYTGSLTLDDVPSDLDPDSYTGTISVVISNTL